MTGPAQRLLLAAAILAAALAQAVLAPSAPGQTAPAPASASTASADGLIVRAAVRNFLPAAYGADPQNLAVAVDRRGILYFGNRSGVLEFDGVRWRLIAMPGNGGATALGVAADGRVLVGGEGEAGWLAPDATGSMIYVSKAGALPEAFRNSGDSMVQILDTPAGQVYLSDHWLFVESAPDQLIALRSSDHFLQAAWFDGALYVLDSARGLTRFDGRELIDVPGGAQMRGLTMLATEAGLLIPSYDNGLICYAPDAPNHWQARHIAGWSDEDNAGVTSGVVLNPHLVALGTARQGVALLDLRRGALERIGPAQGLTDAHVYSLDYDHDGGLWLALDNGVSLVSLSLPADAEAAPFSAWVRGVTGTGDDRLLFGGTYAATPGGVAQRLQGSAQMLTFPYTYNDFRIAYSANGMNAQGDMQYQTFVQGVDQDWSVWSSRTDREFTSLTAGHWVFLVRARKADGEISSVGTYELRIRPAWYATWWFLVFQVLFVLLILLLPGHTPHPGLQRFLTAYAVIVPFIYIGDWVSGLVFHYYTSDVGFVKVLISSVLSFMLDPMKNYLEKHVHKRNKRRAEIRAKKAARTEEAD